MPIERDGNGPSASGGLHTLGAIDRNAKALGVGAGHEPVLYYLTDRIREVVGTDLYGNDAWTNNAVGGNEANVAVLEKRRRLLSAIL